MEPAATPSITAGIRNPRFIGARVIRGPDWKWGKQVSSVDPLYFLIFMIVDTTFRTVVKDM